MYAVIVTGGKQYRVQQGDTIFVEKLAVAEGETVQLRTRFWSWARGRQRQGGRSCRGRRFCCGQGHQERQGQEAEHIITYRPKKGSARRMGHRQPYTKVANHRDQSIKKEEMHHGT